jgi:Protein of unknown function (DUF1587)./Protein of unknown function (DUF1592)./Protein of unknown function (DUF1588)./Protein of unknown function (DUF1585)./Protein of unknown function (DUF1595).
MKSNFEGWIRPSAVLLGLGSIVVLLAFQNCGGQFEALEQASSDIDGSLGGGGGGGTETKVCTTPSATGQALIRKLNRQELNNSLQDILGVTGDFTSALSPDASDISGFTNNAENLQLDSDYMYTLLTMTERAVSAALTKANSSYLQCTGGQNAACAKLKLQEVGKRAYRRPLAAADEARLLEIFNKAQTSGASFSEALGYAMQRVFVSPSFLYRTAFSGEATLKGIKLSQHELATRIAYFLWNSTPDTTLMAAADSGKLLTADDIRVQVKRLLMDEKADRFIRNFTGEWIGMQKLQAAARTGLTDQLKADMQEETERLMLSILREDKSPVDVISADYTYVNANLAAHYGIAGVSGTQFRKVEFSPMAIQRRGLLTQGSLLTLTSSPSETKPVARGAQILNNITCNPPPPFPDGLTVTPLADSPNANASIRERMAQHRQVGTSCFNCHKEMDPVGLGLENYDQLGRYRVNYATSGNPVEAYGTIRNFDFKNGMELIDFIVKQDDFKRCITKKLMGYAIGRTIASTDQCAVENIGKDFVVEGKTFSDLIAAIVLSDQFMYNQTSSRGE